MTLHITILKNQLKRRKWVLEPSKPLLHLLSPCSALKKLMYCFANGTLFSRDNCEEKEETRAVRWLVGGHTASHANL